VFHNFVDGLAIGSAYSQSLSMGLSTSLAVAFHEIPQELGDYGVLIKAGFTKPWALAFNFITACTAFLGVIIGLGVGRAVTDANKWILAFTAGGFFYIALADLMPELNSHVPCLPPTCRACVSCVSCCVSRVSCFGKMLTSSSHCAAAQGLDGLAGRGRPVLRSPAGLWHHGHHRRDRIRT
jgi:hypothetical protein